MAWFKIYAGLGGGFGGAIYHGTYEYDSMNDAQEDAYQLALEEYQSYEGYHGLMSYADCEEDLRDSRFIDEDMTDDEIDDMVYSHYLEEIESWVSFYVLPATGPDDHDD